MERYEGGEIMSFGNFFINLKNLDNYIIMWRM